MSARRRPGALRSHAPRLAVFLALSLGVHAGLLLVRAPAPEIRTVAGSVLSVSLSVIEPPQQAPADLDPAPAKAPPPPPPKPAPRRAPQPADTAARRPPESPGAAARTAKARPPARATGSNAPAPGAEQHRTPSAPETPVAASKPSAHSTPERPVTQAAAAKARETARARVRELVLADVARYFEYPWLARRRGWQGMVWLSITVRPDGALERIHVTRSSGYDVLDRSAVETMQRVGPLAHAGRWLDGAALELPLAIVYRLTD